MKTTLCAWLLLLAVVFAQAQEDSNLIRGRLLDATTGKAVADVSNVWVQVGLFDPVSHRAVWNQNYLMSAVTQPDGKFAVSVPKTPQDWHVWPPVIRANLCRSKGSLPIGWL